MTQPTDNLAFLKQLAVNCGLGEAGESARKNLKLLCTYCNAGGGVLLKLLFHNEAAPQNFDTLAFYARNRRLSDRLLLHVDDLDERVWRQIEQGKIGKLAEGLSASYPRPCLFLPVGLNGHSSLVLLLTFQNVKELENVDVSVLKAATATLNLWAQKLDVEHRLVNIMDTNTHPVHIIDDKLKVRYWNSAIEKWTNWPREKLIGKGNYEDGFAFYGYRRPTLIELLLEPDPSWEEHFLRFDRQGNTVYAEGCATMLLGGLHSKIKIDKLFDLNQRVWGAVAMVQNINPAEQHIRVTDNDRFYNRLCDFAETPLLIFRQSSILFYNKAFLKLFPLKVGDKPSMYDFLEHLNPEDAQRLKERFDTLFTLSAQDGYTDFRLANDAGSEYRVYYWVENYGGYLTAHLTIKPVLEHDYHARDLNLHKLAHKDRLTSLGAITSGIAHEINQPLSTINLIMESWQYDRDNQIMLDDREFDGDLETVKRQISRIAGLTDIIRQLAKQRQPKDVVVPVDINQTILKITGFLDWQFRNAKTKLTLDLADEHLTLPSVSILFDQIFINLLLNALYAFEGVEKNRIIWIKTSRCPDKIVVELSDNARGVPENLQVKIFQPFFSGRSGGTGLGLAICKSIIADMGGSLTMENNAMGGATFFINLPV